MPKQIAWTSEITEVRKNKLITRGVDQEEIIRSFRYEEMIYLLLFGKKPSPVEADLLRSVIVSHCSHGITGQSTLAVRMAADCGSPFLNSALAGFLVGSGQFHQGALPLAMSLIKEASEANDIEEFVLERIKSRKPFYGFGHRFHSKDPRATILMELCDKHDCNNNFVHTVREIERVIGSQRGRFLNIEGAGGAILLNLGFPVEISPLIILIGRTPMYAAAYLERLRSGSKPFQRLAVHDIVPSGNKL
jgi:citrate synthase